MSSLKETFKNFGLEFETIEENLDRFEMDTYVWAKPGAKKERIAVQDGKLVVAISEKPVDGQANKGIIKFLSKKLGISQGQIELCRGEKSKHKRFRLCFDFTNSKDLRYYQEKIEKAMNS